MHTHFRKATQADVSAMTACRAIDPSVGPADKRMSAYFLGEHHPQHALLPRTGFVAEVAGQTIGYIAGHLTTRHSCQGEVQYLFVSPQFRRQGIASRLMDRLADWFLENSVRRVCVNVDGDSPSAEPFYAALGARPLSPLKRYWYIWDDVSTVASMPRRITSAKQ